MQQLQHGFNLMCRLFARISQFGLRLNDPIAYLISDEVFGGLLAGLLGVILVWMLFPIFYMLNFDYTLVLSFLFAGAILMGILYCTEWGFVLEQVRKVRGENLIIGLLGFMIQFGVFLCFREVYYFISGFFVDDQSSAPSDGASGGMPSGGTSGGAYGGNPTGGAPGGAYGGSPAGGPDEKPAAKPKRQKYIAQPRYQPKPKPKTDKPKREKYIAQPRHRKK